MARNYFSYTVIKADQTLNAAGAAVLTSLADVTWDAYSLNAAGAATSATVYSARSNGISSTGGVTSYNGVIEFWAEPGEYKISISDPSSRIGDQDIFWSSVSGQEGGIPGTKISNDNALISNQIQDGAIATADIGALQVTNAKLAADSVTTAKIADLQVTGTKIADNVLPLGSVIDWYRVTSGTFVPTGWAVCDGSLWNDIDNHMGASKAKLTTGNIPNLIGKVTVGARLTVASGGSGGAADGTGSTNGDAYANAPGIGGTGGSNATIPGHGHAHTIAVSTENSHTHPITVASGGSHSHPVNVASSSGNTGLAGGHSHTAGGDAAFVVQLTAGNVTGFLVNYRNAGYDSAFAYQYATAQADHRHSVTIDNSAEHGHSASSTAGAGHSHGITGTVGANNTNGDSPVDVRPAHVGLLKIMKVKIV